MATAEELLNQQLAHLNELYELLEQELGYISRKQSQDLLNSLEKKSQLLENIQQLDKQIESAFAALEKVDIPQAQTNLLAEIQTKLAQCKRKTAVNQKAVEQSQINLARLRKVLNDLRTQESLTYDKSGKPTGGTLGRGIKA